MNPDLLFALLMGTLTLGMAVGFISAALIYVNSRDRAWEENARLANRLAELETGQSSPLWQQGRDPTDWWKDGGPPP